MGDHRDLRTCIDQSWERSCLWTLRWDGDRRINNNLVLNDLNVEGGHGVRLYQRHRHRTEVNGFFPDRDKSELPKSVFLVAAEVGDPSVLERVDNFSVVHEEGLAEVGALHFFFVLADVSVVVLLDLFIGVFHCFLHALLL